MYKGNVVLRRELTREYNHFMNCAMLNDLYVTPKLMDLVYFPVAGFRKSWKYRYYIPIFNKSKLPMQYALWHTNLSKYA